jgi:Xaa-Pro aminopeptidase
VALNDHAIRLARSAETAGSAGLDALVVAPSADLVYLTGYDPPPLERLTLLVIRPGEDPILVVPQLERPLAEDAGIADLGEVRAWGETEDPYAAVAGITRGGERIGCSDRLWAVHLLGLQRAMDGAVFSSAAPVLGGLRAIKDPQELDLLKRSARYADETFARVVQTRLETRTEEEVASQLAELLLETGNDEVTFTIVGAGPNGASPHHEPTGREIHAGDPVVMDFGGRTGGYCSDITRTVAVVEPPAELRHVFDVVREA